MMSLYRWWNKIEYRKVSSHKYRDDALRQAAGYRKSGNLARVKKNTEHQNSAGYGKYDVWIH